MARSMSSRVGGGTCSGQIGAPVGLGERVVVQEHEREVVAAHLGGLVGDVAGVLLALGADDRRRDHHVVVDVPAHGRGLGHGLLVGLHVAAHLVDGADGEAEHADAVAAGLGVGVGVAGRHPDRWVRGAAAVGLGEDVALGRRERRPVVGVERRLPHLLELPDDLVPHGLGLGGPQAEGADLVRAGAAAAAELEAALGQVVAHGDPLGQAHRVVLRRVQRPDARAHVDALGERERVRDERLARREVRVLGEGVVLAHPGVLEAVPVGLDDQVDVELHRLVLGGRVVGHLAVQGHLDEDPELHADRPSTHSTLQTIVWQT